MSLTWKELFKTYTMIPNDEIYIGTRVFAKEPVYFIVRRSGVIGVFAMSRWGKTSIVSSILLGMQEDTKAFRRNVIVFDFGSEWAKNLTNPNNQSENPSRLWDYIDVKNFTFKFSSFNTKYHWFSLGVADKASMILAELARRTDLHNDDPQMIQMYIDSIKNHSVTREFPQLKLASKDIRAYDACVASFETYKRYFHGFNKLEPIDWKQTILDNKVTIINLVNLPPAIKKAYAGAILKEISHPVSFLKLIEPLIICEEADKLFPRSDGSEGEVPPLSVVTMKDYGLKYQKYGVALLLITQDDRLIHGDISKHITDLLLGPQVRGSTYYDVAKGVDFNWKENVNHKVWLMKTREENHFIKVMVPPPRCQV